MSVDDILSKISKVWLCVFLFHTIVFGVAVVWAGYFNIMEDDPCALYFNRVLYSWLLNFVLLGGMGGVVFIKEELW